MEQGDTPESHSTAFHYRRVMRGLQRMLLGAPAWPVCGQQATGGGATAVCWQACFAQQAHARAVPSRRLAAQALPAALKLLQLKGQAGAATATKQRQQSLPAAVATAASGGRRALKSSCLPLWSRHAAACRRCRRRGRCRRLWACRPLAHHSTQAIRVDGKGWHWMLLLRLSSAVRGRMSSERPMLHVDRTVLRKGSVSYRQTAPGASTQIPEPPTQPPAFTPRTPPCLLSCRARRCGRRPARPSPAPSSTCGARRTHHMYVWPRCSCCRATSPARQRAGGQW